jgi:hypothetical protein
MRTESLMDAFSVATEMLADVELSPGQTAQLQALHRTYYQRACALLHRTAETSGRADVEPTAEEVADLQARLVVDVRATLTPEQRKVIDRK